jgi:formyltetrahydrofolate deformylase
MAAAQFVVTLSCPDRPGIVAAVSGHLAAQDNNILEAQQFDDTDTGRFFMRIVLESLNPHANLAPQPAALNPVAAPIHMQWQLRDRSERRRVLLLVSKFDHCLADVLYRWRTGELSMDIAGIVANHPRETYRHLDLDAIPFHYLPADRDHKAAQEALLWQVIEQSQCDLVVLARYMQVLSNELTTKLAGRCINIHHSFLPGFKGARPYHQAHSRGVKLIGATAHYVTSDLDEGPIIEQVVERVDHSYDPDQLRAAGRDMECLALSRAIRLQVERRVFLNGQRTVVLR